MKVFLLRACLLSSLLFVQCSSRERERAILPVMRNVNILLDALDWKAWPYIRTDTINRSINDRGLSALKVVWFDGRIVKDKTLADVDKWINIIEVEFLNFALWDSISAFSGVSNQIMPPIPSTGRGYSSDERLSEELRALLSRKSDAINIENKVSNFLATCNHPPKHKFDSVSRSLVFEFENLNYSVNPDTYALLCMAYFFRGNGYFENFVCQYRANGIVLQQKYNRYDKMFSSLYNGVE